MHAQRPLEYCFICDEPTGRAGQGDGSLYCECDKGPFCEDCWEKHHNADTKIADLLKALEYGNKVCGYIEGTFGHPYLTRHQVAKLHEVFSKAIDETKGK